MTDDMGKSPYSSAQKQQRSQIAVLRRLTLCGAGDQIFPTGSSSTQNTENQLPKTKLYVATETHSQQSYQPTGSLQSKLLRIPEFCRTGRSQLVSHNPPTQHPETFAQTNRGYYWLQKTVQMFTQTTCHGTPETGSERVKSEPELRFVRRKSGGNPRQALSDRIFRSEVNRPAPGLAG